MILRGFSVSDLAGMMRLSMTWESPSPNSFAARSAEGELFCKSFCMAFEANGTESSLICGGGVQFWRRIVLPDESLMHTSTLLHTFRSS